MRLLVIEDEPQLCAAIAKGLRFNGYEVDTCQDGQDALEMCIDEAYDLILLDLSLPRLDGMDILKRVRENNAVTPILIVSARGQIQDKVAGLDMGANDYLTKPFHFEELEARVRSLTRRKFIQENVNLICGEISFDTKSRTAYAKGHELSFKDTGIGIPPEHQEQIFTPFFRVDKSRSRMMGGAGLGLALVKDIVKQHGGKICVVQSSYNGTEIAMVLPANILPS